LYNEAYNTKGEPKNQRGMLEDSNQSNSNIGGNKAQKAKELMPEEV